MWEYIFWGVIFLIALLAEAATTAFISIWLAAGALLAFFAAVFGASIAVQCTVFVVAALLLFIATRPLVKKLNKSAHVATNADSIIGTEGVVRQSIETLQNGRVCVNNLDWSARSVSGSPIEAGSRIVVEKIEGATLLVRPIDPSPEA